MKKTKRSPKKKGLIAGLGPGLITGVADDDPSGIATYSQTGAQYGFGLLWTMLFTYPLMTGIQIICAHIGRVTGRGIAANMRKYYSRWLLYPVVGLLVVANTINIAADLGAMGEALRLLIGGPTLVYTVIFGIVSIIAEVKIPYSQYSKYLKWITLSLFTYVATIFIIHVPWEKAMRATLLPSFHMNKEQLQLFIAILGTTISPYLFFWQASEEVEDVQAAPDEQPLKHAPNQAVVQFKRIHSDTFIGMGTSNLVAYFIILTTALTLNAHGVTKIDTAAQAAEALRPIAGPLCFFLFSAGIIGTGLLAIPVLAGSAAYAVAEAAKWPVGLEKTASQAKGFYGVIAISVLLGLALNFTHVDPIKALVWTAIINGVVAVPLMFVIMLIASSKKAMGNFPISRLLKFFGWLTFLVMLVATVGMFAS